MTDDTTRIVIEFEPTEADYLQAIRAAAARHRGLRWMRLTLLFAPIVMIALSMREGHTLAQAAFRNIFWLIVVPLFFLFSTLSQRTQARRAQRRASERGATRQVMVFDELGIRFGSDESQPLLPWHEIRRVLETRESLLIYVSAREAAYLPMSALAPHQLEPLRRLLHDELGDRFESAAA